MYGLLHTLGIVCPHPESERAAFIFLALDLDRAFQLLTDLLAYRESNAIAAHIVVGLTKGHEDFIHLLGCHAHSLILHIDVNEQPLIHLRDVVNVFLTVCLHEDFATRLELASI